MIHSHIVCYNKHTHTKNITGCGAIGRHIHLRSVVLQVQILSSRLGQKALLHNTNKQKMKLSNIISSVAVSSILLSSSLPSFAQTVGTSNRVRTEVGNLTTKTDLNIDEVSNYNSNGEAVANTSTYKLEAYGPSATVNLEFDGNNVSGDATASTDVETDPVVIFVQSDATSSFNESENKTSTVNGVVKERGSFFVNDLSIDASAYLK